MTRSPETSPTPPTGPQATELRRIVVDGLDVAYRTVGAGAPVVLLHGWPTSSYLWRHVMPAIAASGRRAIAPDLVGFGASDKPPEAAYTLDFHARMLEGALAALGIERTSLVVHDLGGPIGLLWAVRHPAQLDRLVILDTLVYPRKLLLLRALLTALRLPGLGSLLVSPAGVRLLLRLGSAHRRGIDPHARAEYTRGCRLRDHRLTMRRTILAPSFDEFDEIVDGLPRLAAVDMLVAWAERDLLLPRAEMGRIVTALPRATTTTIGRAGHFLPEDQPDQVATITAAFLSPAPTSPQRARPGDTLGRTDEPPH